ncbi:MAG: hypothetical protein FJ096_07165 [Deltaproteobacteria bacterium]|nr:hypothetical protein [Deltaproteobacteria bacterium]
MGWLKGSETDSGAKTQIYMGGSQTVLGFADQAQRRNRLVFAGLGVGAVVIGVASVGIMKYLEAQAANRVVETYGGLTRCLLGEAPSEAEPVSLRVRGIQLASLSQSDIQRAAKEGAWPDRCAKFAHGLHEALGESAIAETKGKALLEASKKLADTLDQKDAYWKDLAGPVEETFGEAMKAGIVLKERSDVPAPPARVKPLDVDALAKEGAFSEKPLALADVHAQPNSDGTIRFIIDDAKGGVRRACSLTADAARCAPFAKDALATKGSARLLGTSDEGVAGMLAIGGAAFSPDGARVSEAGAIGGYFARDGRGVVLAETSSGLELRAVSGGQTKAESFSLGSLKLTDVKRDARVLWGQLVVLAEDGKDLVLAAAPLTDGKAGSLTTIGPVPKSPGDRGGGSEARIDGCRSGGVTVARARVGTSEYLSFFESGRWSAPLKVPAFGGTLQCQGPQALLTSIEGGSGEASLDAKVAYQSCTPTECRPKSIPVRDFFAGEAGLASSTPLAVGTVDGKLLVAWQAGLRAGLRLRVADADAIATTPDVIVYDDLLQAGRTVEGSTILDMKLLRSDRHAVLLVVTPVGLRALRVTGDGKVTPIKL